APPASARLCVGRPPGAPPSTARSLAEQATVRGSAAFSRLGRSARTPAGPFYVAPPKEAVLPDFRVTLLLVLAARAATATDGPTYGGGPHRLFFNPAETAISASNVGRLKVRWQFLTNAVVTASPAVAVVDLPGEGPTQVAYVASWDHDLYALRV